MDSSSRTEGHEPILIKVVLLGKLGVGKSAMTVRFLTKRFIGEYDPNIGSIYHHSIKLENQEVNVEILDTGGEQDFTETKEACSLWGDVFILVYAINDRSSFATLTCIQENLEKIRNHDPPVITLVGNKKDAEDERKVTTMEGTEFAKTIPCAFCEISTSASYKEVESVFVDVVRAALREKLVRQAVNDVRRGSCSKIKELMAKHVSRNRAMSSLKETIDQYCMTRSPEDFIDKRDRSGTCTF